MTPDPSAAPPPRRSALRRWLNRMEVDQAVFFSVCSRGWPFLAGPITALLIAGSLSKPTQGFYYAFASVLAVQTLLELGLPLMTLFAASHEWPRLSLSPSGEVAGDPQALANLSRLTRLVFGWYAVLAAVFGATVVPMGLWWLGRRDDPAVLWRAPWIATGLLTSLNVALAPGLTLLEGCHQVAAVNRYRLIQLILGNAAVWTILALGGGLWAAAASAGVRLACEAFVVCGVYGRFFRTLLPARSGASLLWGRDLWPLQWRSALQGVLGYFSNQIFVLAAFEIEGTTAAARIGMTWSVLTALQAGALAWVQTRAPLMASLIARREFRELDRVFFRVAGISLLVMAAGSAVIVLGVRVLESLSAADGALRAIAPGLLTQLAEKISPRILPSGTTAVFCLALLFTNAALCLGTYVRAHRCDPLLGYNVVSSGLSCTLILYGALYAGAWGAALALLASVLAAGLPFHWLVWRRIRATHNESLPA